MDRQYSRTGLGEDTDVVECEELAAVRDAVSSAGPKLPQHIDRLVRAPTTGGELDSDRGGFPVKRSQPDGDHLQPSAGQDVDGGQLFGQYNRVPVGQQQHCRAQHNAIGDARDERRS